MWTEKYRPRTLNDVVGQHEAVTYFANSLNDGRQIEHCIFKGPCGTGKTTIAHAVASDFDVDMQEFNASEDRRLNFIRGTIIPAMRHLSICGNNFKILFLDECESLDVYALRALRRPMEQYGARSKLFFSCNNDKWLQSDEGQAILSRCMLFEFKPIPVNDMKKRLQVVAGSELVDISDDMLELICKKTDGDLRKAINLLKAYKNNSLYLVDNFDKMFQNKTVDNGLKFRGDLNYG